jgi:hypothetical protein
MKRLKSNCIVAFAVFFFTFITSYANNTWSTSLYRSLYGFFLFFLFMFPVKWMLHLFLNRAQSTQQPVQQPVQTGSAIDIKTPEEDLMQQLSDSTNQRGQDKLEDKFVPLSPPKLSKHSAVSNMKPEDLANAVRTLSSQR